MLIRRAIFSLVLCAYLLATLLAGLGRVVICQYVDGSVAIEAEGSGCCSDEVSPDEHAHWQTTEDQTCRLCHDIALGQMPDRDATATAKAKVRATVELLPPPALIAIDWIVFPYVAIGSTHPASFDLRPSTADVLMQGIVLRC